MPARVLSCLALVGLIALPAPARLGAAEPATPTLVVRIKSIDTLMADLKTLAGLAGAEEQANQLDAILKSKIGAKGFEGIDPKRPLGLYGTVTSSLMDASAVVLVPIADDKTFLDLLERLNIDVEKGQGGVYTVAKTGLPMAFYFRFANKYVYITARDKSALDKDKLLDPAKVLPPGATGTLSVVAQIDQVPDEIKQIALQQLEFQLADAQDKKRDKETETQRQLRIQILKEVSRRVASIVKDGKTLSLQIDLDRQANELVFDVSLTGKSGSKLTTDIAELDQTNLFAGTHGGDSAMNGLFHLVLPEAVRKALDPVIDESIKTALEKESDENKRAGAEKLLRALTPSLKAGELDTAFTLRGPSAGGKYGLVLGIKVKDGQAIEATARELLKTLPEGDRAKIKLDAETAGDIKIHRADVQKDFDAKTKDLFGDNPMYTAFRSDAWFFAFGEGGLEALKEALPAKSKAGPQIQFEMSLARLAPLMARETKNAVKFAEDSFGQGGDKDKLRFTVEGGKALRARFAMKAEVIKFVSLVSQSKKSDD